MLFGSNEEMVEYLLSIDALKTKEIIDAFRKVDRKDFVPERLKKYAYVNEPLPLKDGQTISQPLTVAVMTEKLQPKKDQKILEVGAGSGYQAAILAEIVGKKGKVITTERLPSLVEMAKKNLEKYKNVLVVRWDGSTGYEKEAPYERIMVTASAPSIPKPLLNQLKSNGRMVIPVGNEMFLIEKNHEIKETLLGYYVFVPLIGKHGYRF